MSGSDTFPIDAAQLVGLFLECILYGLYLTTCCACLRALHGRARQRWPFVLVALALFTIATLDVALGLRYVLDAFIYYHGPGGAKAELMDTSYWVTVMRTVDYIAQTGIADGMLIYRCYVVWAYNWQIAAGLGVLWLGAMGMFPTTADERCALTTCTCTACGVWVCYVSFTLHTGILSSLRSLTPFVTSVLSLTLVLNLLATSLILYRIWAVRRQNTEIMAGGGPLARAMRIVIESGVVYSLSVIVFFVVYVAGNNALYVVPDPIIQIIVRPVYSSTDVGSLDYAQGIVFNLIIARVEQGRTFETSLAFNGTRTKRGLDSIQFAPNGTARVSADRTFVSVEVDLEDGSRP